MVSVVCVAAVAGTQPLTCPAASEGVRRVKDLISPHLGAVQKCRRDRGTSTNRPLSFQMVAASFATVPSVVLAFLPTSHTCSLDSGNELLRASATRASEGWGKVVSKDLPSLLNSRKLLPAKNCPFPRDLGGMHRHPPLFPYARARHTPSSFPFLVRK